MKSFAMKEMWKFSQFQLKGNVWLWKKGKRLSSFCFYALLVSVCFVLWCQEIV